MLFNHRNFSEFSGQRRIKIRTAKGIDEVEAKSGDIEIAQEAEVQVRIVEGNVAKSVTERKGKRNWKDKGYVKLHWNSNNRELLAQLHINHKPLNNC